MEGSAPRQALPHVGNRGGAVGEGSWEGTKRVEEEIVDYIGREVGGDLACSQPGDPRQNLRRSWARSGTLNSGRQRESTHNGACSVNIRPTTGGPRSCVVKRHHVDC